MSSSFRAAYKNDWRRRSIDAICHVVLAVILPGPFWLQFLPDCCLLILWPYSIATDRYLPVSSIPVVLHRLCHNMIGAGMLASYVLWSNAHSPFLSAVAIQWSAHLVVDNFTHGEEK